MRNIFKYAICALFAGLTLTACSPEEYEGANGRVPDTGAYADMFQVTVDQTTNNVTFTFVETPGVTPVWSVDGEAFSTSTSFTKYYRKKGEHYVDCYVKDRNGMSKEPLRKTFEIEKTKMNGFGGMDVASEHNLFNTANPARVTFWFADNNWSQVADPALTTDPEGKAYTIKIGQVGPQRWQGQFVLNDLGMQLKAGVKYDFTAIVTASKPITANGGFMFKMCNQDNGDDPILIEKTFKIDEAGEPKCIYAAGVEIFSNNGAASDINNAKIVIDLGGAPEGTEFTIEEFALMESQYNTVEMPADLAAPFNYSDPNNLWRQFDTPGAYTEATWFGDAGWAQIPADIKCTLDGSHHKFVIPETTVNEQWHAQYSIHVPLALSMNDKYDISVCVRTSAPLPGMTLKFTEDGNDDNFFMADRQKIASEYVWRYEGVQLPKQDAPKLNFQMDFAGAEKGTEIDVYDICIIKK